MTNISIKNDSTFTIAKSEGSTDFPRKFYPVVVSGNQLKLRTLSNNDALNFDVWGLENFQIDGVTYTDVFAAQNALLAITWNQGVEPPESTCTKGSFQLFEDVDGNVLFGKIDDSGIMKYYKPDGLEYAGDVKPYSREVQQTITDYCADAIPYSLIQLRDSDSKEVVATIWRNDLNLLESNIAPANVKKGVCVAEDLNGGGKKLDFLQWRCIAGDVLSIPANKFTTISMHAGKGEFVIENTVNNFSGDVVSSGTAPFNYIEFSADGIGTGSGATDLPIGFDTRANAYDLSVIDNAFNISCIRDGVLNLELYK
jgi:hypothetical protein